MVRLSFFCNAREKQPERALELCDRYSFLMRKEALRDEPSIYKAIAFIEFDNKNYWL